MSLQRERHEHNVKCKERKKASSIIFDKLLNMTKTTVPKRFLYFPIVGPKETPISPNFKRQRDKWLPSVLISMDSNAGL